jgi:benzoyl-CoA reductase/2-hydroxyglutaryl-CoA dehydratase subunit BcrC/BadD/HgdB
MLPVKKIGYFYADFPREIIYAFGWTPVQLLPTGPTVAGSEAFLPRNFCTLTKSLLALSLDGQGPCLDGVVFTSNCDAQRRLYDVWREYLPVQALAFLDVPRLRTPAARERFARLLGDLVAAWEERFGQRLSPEALAQAIQVYNHQRRLWQEVQARWLEGRMATRRYYDLRRLCLTNDPVWANERLAEALEGARERETMPLSGPRVLLLGSLAVNEELVGLVEEDGGRIVGEDSAVGELRAVVGVAPGSDVREMLHAIATAYLARPPAPRQRDLGGRLAWVKGLADSRQARGVICSYYKFCDLYLSEFPPLREALATAGYPVLLIEDEGESGLSGQVRTRVQAFLEMLR